MRALRSSRVAKLILPVLAVIALVVSVGGSAADAQRGDRLGEWPGRPDYELPDDFEPPPAPQASVRLTAEAFDWSWPGVYDSAFRIEYTVANTGDVRLDDFRIVESNTEHILHDCYNYDQPLDPGDSVTCSALLHQTVNPQTVRSIVYSRAGGVSGWITDRTNTTYARSSIAVRPIEVSEAAHALGDAFGPN